MPSLPHRILTSLMLAALAFPCRATIHEDARRVLWWGGLPDSSMLDRIAQSPRRDDSLLVASALLAAGDSVGALSWHPLTGDTSSLAWEVVEARHLALRRANGEDVAADLLALWRRFPTSEVGRRCALAALHGGGGPEAAVIAADLSGWPASQRAQAWLAMVAIHDAAGAPQAAEAALRGALATGAQPFAAMATESLVSRVGSVHMDSRTREDAAAALLAGGRAAAAVALLPESPVTEAQRLLRARALIAAGRRTEGVAALRSLSRGTTSLSADALWSLAGHEKRIDHDSLAAEHYYSLVRRFPASARAPDAAWEAAWAFERTGQFARAGVLYRDILRRWPHGPNSDNSRFRWGLVAWRSGDEAAALKRWMITWPYLRDSRARAAVAYWLGKAHLVQGHLDESKLWWGRARDAAPESFYGLRAQQRAATTALETRSSVAMAVPVPDLAAWLAGWNSNRPQPPSRGVSRAFWLYEVGFAVEAKAELRAALNEAGRSPVNVAEVLHLATTVESPDIVASAAARLKEAYEASPGRKAPLWLERMAMPVPFRSLLLPIAARHTLDPCLVSALIRKESFYERTAVSRAGAAGLMQLMPQTAVATARLVSGLDPQRLTEVATNLSLGCLHLREALDLNGTLIRALAAYNAGPGSLRRWVATLPAHDDELWVECITYSETRHYVKTVLAFTWRYQDLWPELRHGNPFATLGVE